MNLRAGLAAGQPRGRRGEAGFSLVELLLVTALLVLLLGAVAFNFSSVRRNADLDEGAAQLESLLRYARAHAASAGRRVQITFEEDVGDGLLVPLGNLSVTWEPDPLGRPGEFEPLPETASLVSSLLDVISIERVRPVPPHGSTGSGAIEGPSGLGAAGAGVTAAASAGGEGGPAGAEEVGDGSGVDAFSFPPVEFHPDGSSDAVEITIAARSGEDPRRVVLKMSGLTGSIRRRVFVETPMLGGDDSATGGESSTGSRAGTTSGVDDEGTGAGSVERTGTGLDEEPGGRRP